jgi:hypothetical protein
MSATRSDRLMTYRAVVKHVSGTAEAAELFRRAGFRVDAYRIFPSRHVSFYEFGNPSKGSLGPTGRVASEIATEGGSYGHQNAIRRLGSPRSEKPIWAGVQSRDS